MYIGLDIGYSSVKVAYGSGPRADSTSSMPEVLRMPVGAAPKSKCGLSISGDAAIGMGHIVMVNGEEWVGAVLPQTLQNFVPVMDESYSRSQEYEALFKAALSEVGAPVVESVVTGLPVAHFLDPEIKGALVERMTGVHEIRPGLTVEVKQVKVVPQPAGAYGAQLLDIANRQSRTAIDPSQTILVVDPGHFSLDWVINSQGSFKLESSGSTPTAGEAIVRRAAELLSATHKLKVRPAKVQDVVLSGAKPLAIGGREIDIWPAMKEAAAEVVRNNLKAIRGSIREVNNTSGVDLVLIAGGGADLFEDGLGEAFPEAQVLAVRDSITANARGFWVFATQMKGPKAQASA